MSKAPSARFHELDSLRGLAAMTVLFGHTQSALYTVPHTGHANLAQTARMLLMEPFVAGHEAVMFFFTLSGFVLALPYLAGRSLAYPAYAERRTLRIYGPYLVALVAFLACVAVFHGQLQHSVMAASQLGHETWTTQLAVRMVLAHLFFIGVYNMYTYNPVIWSLVYEMRISLIYPWLFRAATRFNPWKTWLVFFGISASVVVSFAVFNYQGAALNLLLTLHYMLFFVTGILMAANREKIGAFYQRLSPRMRSGFFVLSLGLFWYPQPILRHLFKPIQQRIQYGMDWPVLLGVVGIMIVAMNSQRFKQMLTTPVPSFLGRISYSLYLTHMAIVLSLGVLLGPYMPSGALMLLILTTSLLFGTLFHYQVERRFTELSHRVGRVPSKPVVAAEAVPSEPAYVTDSAQAA